jgi:resuscitation-promoting factor RpfB
MRSKPIRSARSLRTQYLFAAAIPVLIVTLSITGFVWAQRPVTVIVDGQTSRMKTHATDVAGLLRQADVAVGAGDVVTPVRETPVSGGMTVIVRHSTPVTLNLGGRTIALNVVGKSVADALVAAGIDPAANPSVTPALAAKLERNMTITAPKVFKRVSRERVKVPYGRLTRHDSRLPAGVRKVLTKGRPGAGLRLYSSFVANGIEGPRVLAAEKTVAPPVDEVVAIGTATRSRGNRAIVASARALARVHTKAAPEPGTGRRMRCEATGYATGSGGADETCATGAHATRGVIAVDPRVIPLGTHVFVPGYGYAVAADTGGDIQGNRIDLCYDSYQEAIRWGRRGVTIIILD